VECKKKLIQAKHKKDVPKKSTKLKHNNDLNEQASKLRISVTILKLSKIVLIYMVNGSHVWIKTSLSTLFMLHNHGFKKKSIYLKFLWSRGHWRERPLRRRVHLWHPGPLCWVRGLVHPHFSPTGLRQRLQSPPLYLRRQKSSTRTTWATNAADSTRSPIHIVMLYYIVLNCFCKIFLLWQLNGDYYLYFNTWLSGNLWCSFSAYYCVKLTLLILETYLQ